MAFTYLYEGQVDQALATLTAFAGEYEKAGQPFGIPEVFIWNSIARINLENNRLEAAMKAYEHGYESVPDSNLDETRETDLVRAASSTARVGPWPAWASTRRPGRTSSRSAR